MKYIKGGEGEHRGGEGVKGKLRGEERGKLGMGKKRKL